MKLIKVYSKTCGPCKVLEKNLIKSGVKYESIDILTDEGENITRLYDIKAVPTLLLIDDNGTLISKNTGIISPEKIKEFLNNA